MDIVKHVDAAATEFCKLYRRKLYARAASVGVSSNCRNRGNLAKLIENRRIAHIPGMQDVFHSAESFNSLGAQKAMCVGDNANLHT